MRTARGLIKTISKFFEIFAPAACLSCKHESPLLICARCHSKIIKIKSQEQNNYSYAEFEGLFKNLIYQFKFENKFALSKPFAQFLEDALPADILPKIDMLIPVPLHLKKLRKRKYNQSALLAKDLAGRLNRPYSPHVLIKPHATPSQTELSRSLRKENIRNAFGIAHAEKIAGKQILLVDDVCTTGATLHECAKMLKRAGAARVFTVTLAKTLFY